MNNIFNLYYKFNYDKKRYVNCLDDGFYIKYPEVGNYLRQYPFKSQTADKLIKNTILELVMLEKGEVKIMYDNAVKMIDECPDNVRDKLQRVIDRNKCNHWDIDDNCIIKDECFNFGSFWSCEEGKVCEEHKCECCQ